jgi:hypothetical protein
MYGEDGFYATLTAQADDADSNQQTVSLGLESSTLHIVPHSSAFSSHDVSVSSNNGKNCISWLIIVLSV